MSQERCHLASWAEDCELNNFNGLALGSMLRLVHLTWDFCRLWASNSRFQFANVILFRG